MRRLIRPLSQPLSRRLSAPGGGTVIFTPETLGAKLLAFWDAERSATITQAAGKVSSWTTVVGGITPTQSTENNKPAYNATGFNGRPCIIFDGVDDVLTVANIGSMPIGAAASELWAVVDSEKLAADTAIGVPFAYGGNANMRSLRRAVVTGVSRGQGTGASINTNAAVVFEGRHLIRYVLDGTTHRADVDGIAGVATALVPATVGGNTRIGASSATTPNNFFQGKVNCILVTTNTLTAQEVSNLYAWLTTRRAL